MTKNTKHQRTFAEIVEDQRKEKHNQFLIGVIKEEMKRDAETLKTTPSYAEYLKKHPEVVAEKKARQDHFAKLDPTFALWLQAQRARQKA